MKKLISLFLPIAALSSTASFAATATGNLTVKANVASSCMVNTPASGSASNAVLDFGSVTSLSAPVNADTTTSGGANVSVLCTNKTPWSIAFDGGKNVTNTQRRMAGGTTEFINYNLFTDSARKNAIDISTPAYNGTGTGSVQPLTVYGTIPAGQSLPSAGSYLDTVTVTVTY